MLSNAIYCCHVLTIIATHAPHVICLTCVATAVMLIATAVVMAVPAVAIGAIVMMIVVTVAIAWARIKQSPEFAAVIVCLDSGTRVRWCPLSLHHWAP